MKAAGKLPIAAVNLVLLALLLPPGLKAQAPAPAQARPARTPNDGLISAEVSPDRQVTFRIYAPKAQDVQLSGDFAPTEMRTTAKLTKADNGVWSVTVGPLDPGIYQYRFDVDGVQTVDPKNPNPVESLGGVSSALTVPGADFEEFKADIPHGAVETVWYYSRALSKMSRMHIYTPPGYGTSQKRYPVLYMFHDPGANDDTWTSEGHANFILDNLIAADKAKPMILVMPASNDGNSRSDLGNDNDRFYGEFLNDIIPYVEKNYRVLADRKDRAIAGNAIGGHQVLSMGFAHLDQFAYLGIFSNGLPNADYEKNHAKDLDNASWKNGLKLVWVGVAKEDATYPRVQDVVTLLKAHGFSPVYYETQGAGHNFLAWRGFLEVFASQLFQ